MMAVGANTMPGGYNVLILHTIPLLQPSAMLAYFGVLLGIYLVIISMQIFKYEFDGWVSAAASVGKTRNVGKIRDA